MKKRAKLFSIGEISRHTGASIRSLRYYEKLKILEPAYIDPDSDYRYYSYNQTNLIGIIMCCVDLDIPLKKLCTYIDKSEEIDLIRLLRHGKEIAQKKLKKLQNGLKFIEDFEQEIKMADKYHKGQEIYSRELPEKKFYTKPYKQSFEDADLSELVKPFLNIEFMEENPYEFSEYGYMCEYSPSGIQRYAFIELPKHIAKEGTKIIPAGAYMCRHGEVNQIEQAPNIFREYLEGKTSFLAIESEIFTGKYKMDKPLYEMRVIALH